jgi:hypothetical protein
MEHERQDETERVVEETGVDDPLADREREESQGREDLGGESDDLGDDGGFREEGALAREIDADDATPADESQ